MNEETVIAELCEEIPDPTVNIDETSSCEDKIIAPEETESISEAGEAQSDEADEEKAASDESRETVESLRAELQALRDELEAKRATFERMSAEIGEFSELFPSVSLSSIPDSVWQSVKGGVPLAASYALYEKRTAILLADAKQANEKNSALSTGPLGREVSSDFFSADEVRAMSRDEVRKNYKKIMESMKKWN